MSEATATTNNHNTNNMGASRYVPPDSLEGKVFAITGGASGIGLATAQILSRRGAIVCIADIDPKAMSAAESYFASEASSGTYLVSKVDVSKRAEVDGWIADIVDRFGRLDGAANVAGVIGKIHGLCAVTELEDDEWDRIIAVNLTGTMYCMRAQLRNIADRGSIVNVSSIHGSKGVFPLHAPPSAICYEWID
jgi:NAD(P)-dependent dehydrogenase (short-subunit alcohol dehydrogenase family)